MRLSEAIRLGSMLHPQHYGTLTKRQGGKVVATCALGAALQAGYLFVEMFDCGGATCPVSGCVSSRERVSVASVIGHLNDFHRWTREQIADWVESEELNLWDLRYQRRASTKRDVS